MHILNDTAAELLDLFREKLAGRLISDQRLYALRKELALAAMGGLPYQHERLGDYMYHSECITGKVKLPLTEAAQAELYERMESWVEQRLAEAAKRASRRDTRNEAQLAGQGSIVSSGGAIRKARGKR